MLPLPTLWMKILLLFSKCLEVFISGGVWFSGEPQLLERFWYEVSAVSRSLDLIKGILTTYILTFWHDGIKKQKVLKILNAQLIQGFLKN